MVLLSSGAVVIIAAVATLAIPRTTAHRVNRFEGYQRGVAKAFQEAKPQHETHRAGVWNALIQSITPEQAKEMLEPNSLPVERLTPQQQDILRDLSPHAFNAPAPEPTRVQIPRGKSIAIVVYFRSWNGHEVSIAIY